MDKENWTLIFRLEVWHSTIKLYPHIYRFLSFFAGCIKYISTYETSSSFSSDWIRKLCLPTKISDFHSKARRWTLYWFSHYKHSGSSHHTIYEVVIYYSICPYVLVVGLTSFTNLSPLNGREVQRSHYRSCSRFGCYSILTIVCNL